MALTANVTATPQPREAAILAGDRRAVARAISVIEQGDAGARDLARAVAPHLGRAHVLGITGAPGAGKSTLISALLGALLARGQRIAVVAVDPSSPITGGAVLGDRVRMGEHGGHENVFIRSLASRGHLGGMSRTTREIVDVLDAAGFDTIIVETVGAGQSEVEITGLADTRLVVCPPGLGDSVQAIKAGILEIADILVVSKGDLPAAEVAVRDLEEMLRLRRAGMPPVRVLKTAAARGEGVAAVVDAVVAHAAQVGRGRRFKARETPSADEIAAVDRAITTRHSVRRFLPDPVSRATVAEILAVASRAPSGTNTQPWRAHVLAGESKQALSDAVLRALFFDAPIGLIFTIDRDLERGSWLDYGMFLQNVMVAARGRGLDTCAQASFLKFHRVIGRVLSLEVNESVICAMSLGHADPDAPENRLVTDRAPVTAFARFSGFAGGEPENIGPDRGTSAGATPGASASGAPTPR